MILFLLHLWLEKFSWKDVSYICTQTKCKTGNNNKALCMIGWTFWHFAPHWIHRFYRIHLPVNNCQFSLFFQNRCHFPHCQHANSIKPGNPQYFSLYIALCYKLFFSIFLSERFCILLHWWDNFLTQQGGRMQRAHHRCVRSQNKTD